MIESTAWIEGEYRYSLTRRWADGPLLVIVMLNPSSADAWKPDPTLLRCIHFARLWGFGGLVVVNPFALRSPTPKTLTSGYYSLTQMVGPRCDEAIETALWRGSMFLCAWGNPPSACPAIVDRIKSVEQRILHVAKTRRMPVACLGRTMHGYPKHPLARGKHRVPNDQKPILYLQEAA